MYNLPCRSHVYSLYAMTLIRCLYFGRYMTTVCSVLVFWTLHDDCLLGACILDVTWRLFARCLYFGRYMTTGCSVVVHLLVCNQVEKQAHKSVKYNRTRADSMRVISFTDLYNGRPHVALPTTMWTSRAKSLTAFVVLWTHSLCWSINTTCSSQIYGNWPVEECHLFEIHKYGTIHVKKIVLLIVI